MRILNEIVTELTERILKRNEDPIILYEAPTGYGKTVSSLKFYFKLREHGFVSSHIHVLPMRSITSELYCKLINLVSKNPPDFCLGFGEDPFFKRIIDDSKGEIDLDENMIGYQFMDLIDSSKSPFFLKEILVTTFNSFFHNLVRVPVGEFRKYKRHYEIPRASIFTSSIVLDEAHLYGGDPGAEGDQILLTAFLLSVRVLAESGTPLLIESATIPNVLKDKIRSIVEQLYIGNMRRGFHIISFRYGEACKESMLGSGTGSVIECHDPDFVNNCLNVKWFTNIIDEEEMIKIIDSHYNSDEKILIIRNTVEKAVHTYRELKDKYDDILLIHGRFTDLDRREKLLKIKSRNPPRIIIATQILEAGVNLDYDVLITDAASPSSVVQRVGRIARSCGNRNGYVYIIKSETFGDGIYNGDLVKRFIETILSVDEKCYTRRIEWRIPSEKDINNNKDNKVSFLTILNKAYEDARINIDSELYTRFRDLAVGAMLSHKDINDIIIKLGGNLLHASILLPVFTGNDTPKDVQDLINNSVLISLNYIFSSNDKKYDKLLKTRDNKIAILVYLCDKERCIIDEYYVEPTIIRDPSFLIYGLRRDEKDYKIISPLSLVAKPDAYSKDIGLLA